MKNVRRTEFMLGYESDYDTYVIVSRNTDWPEGEGMHCLLVSENRVWDCDGSPAHYNDTYVRIEEKECRHALKLFLNAGNEMIALAEEYGKPLDRPLSPGDFIYDDCDFLHIHKITDNRSKLWVNRFSYQTRHFYDLEIDNVLRAVDNDRDYDNDEKESNPLLITGDVYRQVLNIATSVIMELNDYLQSLMRKEWIRNDMK